MRLKITCVLFFILAVSLSCFAQTRIDSLKAVVQQSKQGEGYMNALLELCWKYRFSYPDSSIMYGEQVLKESREHKLTDVEAEALHRLSVTYESLSDYGKALEYNEKALALRYKIGNKVKTADTELNRGLIYDSMGRYAQALEYYSKAYRAYKELDKKDKLILIDINLGILYKAQGKYEQVISHYKDAYHQAKLLKLDFEQLVCEANLGSVYLFVHRYDSAMYYSSLAEKGFIRIKNYQSLPVVQCNIGLAYAGLGKPAAARKYFEESLARHREFGNKKEQSFVQIELGKLAKEKKQYSEAVTWLKEALKLAEEVRVIQQQIDAHQNLAEVYALKNNFSDAYRHQKDYVILKDSVYKKESAEALENFSAQYETEKKEQQIEMLSQKTTIQNLELERRSLYMVILISLLSLVSFGAYFIYLKRKQREKQLLVEAELKSQLLKAEAQQKMQDERMRISRELHDNIGSHLTFINTAMSGIADNGTDTEKIKQVKELTAETIKELRKTVWLINKPSVSVAEFAVKLIDLFKNIPHIKVQLEGNENLQLNTAIVTQLFRVVQEAVNNALKYAEAETINVSFAVHNEAELTVEITDNGKGFDAEENSQGFGLSNMKHRVDSVNGKFGLVSKIDKGTCVSVWLPVKNVVQSE